MRRVVLVPLIVLAVGTCMSVPAAQEQKKQAPKQQEKSAKSASMTGCVDQQEGLYVLVDDQALKRIADLESDGFPKEGFAKHVGHKVIVRGTSIAGGERPLFKVRTVETVSETCAPHN
jgi:competence protein ComGC